MVHKLSRITTYIETYAISQNNGELMLRANATGFFIRLKNKILLVTNWHVVTGLDPENPSKLNCFAPEILRISVSNKNNKLTEITIPLYSPEMKPLWNEHPDRHQVDLALIPLPIELNNYFYFFDIESAMDQDTIDEVIGNDVFILGYPFEKSAFKESFGEDNFYYLPIWKRGSIATEPSLKISKKLILIDSLSRPGMSGSPIFLARDDEVMTAKTQGASETLKRLSAGDRSALMDLNMDEVKNRVVKKFNLLGIYSGVIGHTYLSDIALGKCWHKNTIYEAILNPIQGEMPHHAPTLPHEHYVNFIKSFSGFLVEKDINGQETNRVPITNH